MGGYITDRLGMRSPILTPMLLVASLTIYQINQSTKTVLAFLLILNGMLIGGPASLISSAVSADLGTHKSLRGNAAALSTVTGIIDGTGSIGAAFAQYLVGYISNCHTEPSGCRPDADPDCRLVCAWQPVLRLLLAGCCCAALCLIPIIRYELHCLNNLSQSK